MKRLIDTHAHYNHAKYDKDRDEILIDIGKEISSIINVGTNTKSIKETLELMKKYEFIYGIVGYFPSDTEELFNRDTIRFLNETLQTKKIVGIGEIGLDYYWDRPERVTQEKFFRYQLELAIDNNLPVSIHSRNAEEDTFRILSDYDVTGVIHCYSYGLKSAKEYADRGLYFGVGGTSTFPNNEVMFQVIKYLPLTQILLETDAPYLSPVPFRGKRNDSRYLIYIAEQIAKLKGISVEDVINVTSENAKRLFGV